MTYIEIISAATVDIVRRNAGSQSTTGDYISSTVTVLSGASADIQPVSGRIIKTATGESVSADYQAFLAAYPTASIKVNDTVIHGSEVLEVVAVEDWRDHLELSLIKQTVE